MKRLGQVLDNHRRMERLSQRELAEQIGMSRHSLSKLTNGHTIASDQLTKLLMWLLEHEAPRE